MSAAWMSDTTRAWFARAFDEATPVQSQGWPVLAAGRNALLVAPTGTGKTLAAFLAALDMLGRTERAGTGVRVLYVSPLRALTYDMERNLVRPLAEMAEIAAENGMTFFRPQVGVRTGDTTAKARRRLSTHPPDVLLTTPESLHLMLSSAARATLASTEVVIVDELHALLGDKRGAHLSLSLERLAHLAGEPQRIGLSATVRPVAEAAAFLGGDRPVEIVDVSGPPALDVSVERISSVPGDEPWRYQNARLLDLISAHRTTLVFANNRRLCERLTITLNAMHVERGGTGELVQAHHGSLAQERRQTVEAALKAGLVRGLVATSSLELGIDLATVDLVVLLGPSGSVSQALQRVGRAGHQVGAASTGILMPRTRPQLLEAAVVVAGMRTGLVEEIRVPQNALDVLAQILVACVGHESWEVDALFALFRRAHGYRNLPRGVFLGVLDMLAGNLPEAAVGEVPARIVWDRALGLVHAAPGALRVVHANPGTIPDRGLFPVHLGEGGPRVGELDEEMVHESRVGETFVLGASTWRIEQITRDRVIVSPAPGEAGRAPFWRGEGVGRSASVGLGIGKLLRTIDGDEPARARERLSTEHGFCPNACDDILEFIGEQRALAALPTDRTVVIEKFRDELGDWRICILSAWGRRVHAPWALLLEGRLRQLWGRAPKMVWNDDGIVLGLASEMELPGETCFPAASIVRETIEAGLPGSSLFAARFREAAGRALLLPRSRPGMRRPLWLQRLRSQALWAAVRDVRNFPLTLEVHREILRDIFDVGALEGLLASVERGDVQVLSIESQRPSPFARSLVFDYLTAHMYEGDAPTAERRAQALVLDRAVLRELLGDEAEASLLDPTAVADVVAERALRGRGDGGVEGAHGLMRGHGHLDAASLTTLLGADASLPLDVLERARRAARVEIAGHTVWISVEDASRYRDGLGVRLPDGLPDSLLASAPRGRVELFARHARRCGPFLLEEAAAWAGLSAPETALALATLVAEGTLIKGRLRPEGESFCDARILERIKRRSLRLRRREAAPVSAASYATFVARWHGIPGELRHADGLRTALRRINGTPVPWAELETEILPARVDGYTPAMMDGLAAGGELFWVSRSDVGVGWVALHLRENARVLVPPLGDRPTTLPHARLLSMLETLGASFFVQLAEGCKEWSRDALLDALWELAVAGWVTSDAMSALRGWERARHGGRGALVARLQQTHGRWSMVQRDHLTDEERALAWSEHLLDRFGVVTRAAGQQICGPEWAVVRRVLTAMETRGRVQRGLFVDGGRGLDVALPAAIEQLRAGPRAGLAWTTSMTDPANPLGLALPWPEAEQGSGGPRRAPGAWLVWWAGAPVLSIERGGRSLLTFACPDRDTAAPEIARALARGLRLRRKRSMTLKRVNGLPALETPARPWLELLGFRAQHTTLELELPWG